MTARRVIDLSGPWQFRQRGKGKWQDAHVPSTVHTDLLRLGRIGDPFVYPNEQKAQWIEGVGWEYRRRFVLDKADVVRASPDLRADRSLTVAARREGVAACK